MIIEESDGDRISQYLPTAAFVLLLYQSTFWLVAVHLIFSHTLTHAAYLYWSAVIRAPMAFSGDFVGKLPHLNQPQQLLQSITKTSYKTFCFSYWSFFLHFKNNLPIIIERKCRSKRTILLSVYVKSVFCLEWTRTPSTLLKIKNFR